MAQVLAWSRPAASEALAAAEANSDDGSYGSAFSQSSSGGDYDEHDFNPEDYSEVTRTARGTCPL